MSVRLAFAVAVEVDADILLIDEVLAVGDAAFQQKCFEQFERLKREGRTIVLVTHDMSAVERFCDRAMLIDRGRVLRIGDPHEIARAYNELNFGRLVQTRRRARSRARATTASAEIKARVVRGRRRASAITAIAQGAPCTMCIEVRFHAADRGTDLRLPPAQRAAAHGLRDVARTGAASRVGALRGGRDGAREGALRELARARTATRVSPSVAHAGTGADASTCARTSPRVHRPRARARRAAIADAAARVRGGAPMSAVASRPPAPAGRWAATPALLAPHVDARGRPTSSCASTARCSATRGRSCGRSRSSA